MTMRTSLVRIMRWPRLAAVALALLFGTPATAQQVFRDGFEPTVPAFPQNDAEAARFLTQATFGPTLTDIARLRQIGYAAWLDEQFALPPSHQVPYLDMVRAIPEPVYSNARMEAWWLNAVRGPDQLRQRIAYALSQIFVISDASDVIGAPYPVAHYYDLLIDNAFVPYRELLERVTTSPAMGAYLSMLGNRRPDVANNIRPDENYAREILQLFSIGLVQLNPDGSRVLQGGQPVPAYDQFHIKTFAHVFTGWNFGNCDGFEFCYPGYPEAVGWTMPMQPFAAFHHTEIDADPDNDSFLGGQLRPPGGTPQQNLELALDNIAAHPNVGPFIARRLIQNLVTSNPSPQYLARMSAVFANNGQGVRGDLRALVRAILLDPVAQRTRAVPDHVRQGARATAAPDPLLACVRRRFGRRPPARLESGVRLRPGPEPCALGVQFLPARLPAAGRTGAGRPVRARDPDHQRDPRHQHRELVLVRVRACARRFAVRGPGFDLQHPGRLPSAAGDRDQQRRAARPPRSAADERTDDAGDARHPARSPGRDSLHRGQRRRRPRTRLGRGAPDHDLARIHRAQIGARP
jgi:hypothetical protein